MRKKILIITDVSWIFEEFVKQKFYVKVSLKMQFVGENTCTSIDDIDVRKYHAR